MSERVARRSGGSGLPCPFLRGDLYAFWQHRKGRGHGVARAILGERRRGPISGRIACWRIRHYYAGTFLSRRAWR